MHNARPVSPWAALAAAIVVLASLTAPLDAAAQQPPASSSRATLDLRYAGHDPFSGDESAIFVARLSDNSDDPISSADVTARLSYKFALFDDTGWRCVADAELTTTCTRTLPPIGAHLGSEVPIVVDTAAGVCLDASVDISAVVHFADGDEKLTATATAPSACAGAHPTLPATGAGTAAHARSGLRIVLLVATSSIGAAVGALGLTMRHRYRGT